MEYPVVYESLYNYHDYGRYFVHHIEWQYVSRYIVLLSFNHANKETIPIGIRMGHSFG